MALVGCWGVESVASGVGRLPLNPYTTPVEA